ncbi:MAG: aldehyde dehydrogenase family protein [Anaerolineales bacterium]|nr:aldehyde dehydrogenase family protein [Anaerolineales bacterium]
MAEQRILAFVNPATGENFGQIAMTSPEEARRAVGDMRAAARWWRNVSVAERARLLNRFQEVMIDARDEISAVINQDTGKSRQDALIEVFMVADLLHQYCRHAADWLKPEPVPRGLYLFKQPYIERRPYGVVGVIAPWNYPFALAMPPTLAALLAGNTVVLKPSEVTGAVGVLMEQLFRRVPELAPFVRVIHGDAQVGAAMVQARPDFIFLTGSTPTGRAVMRTAAEHLIPVTCELGGKDPLIVLEDADVSAAARWAVWGAYFNTGQTCMSVERVYVVEDVYDEFVSEALRYTKELTYGYSPEKDNPHHFGPMSDPRQIQTIRRHLDDALAKGARLLHGGGLRGMFVEPTLLVDVNHDMLLMQEETFGPLLPIMKVKDEDEAVRLANDSRYGLGASVWSNNHDRARRVARELEVGSVLINDTICQFAVPMLPFGGVKESGFGRIHGKEGLLQFTYSHAVLVGDPPLAWDVATIFRKPGHYAAVAAVMRLAFGANLRQRLEPVKEFLAGEPLPLALPKAEELRLPKLDRKRVGLALGTIGLAAVALAVASFLVSRRHS